MAERPAADRPPLEKTGRGRHFGHATLDLSAICCKPVVVEAAAMHAVIDSLGHPQGRQVFAALARLPGGPARAEEALHGARLAGSECDAGAQQLAARGRLPAAGATSAKHGSVAARAVRELQAASG
jgi:hypothetical protein